MTGQRSVTMRADGVEKMQSDRWMAPLGVVAAGSVFAASFCVLMLCGRPKDGDRDAGATSSPTPMVTMTQNTSGNQPPGMQVIEP